MTSGVTMMLVPLEHAKMGLASVLADVRIMGIEGSYLGVSRPNEILHEISELEDRILSCDVRRTCQICRVRLESPGREI